jgi:prepilin-type N-terminal cleavage/methylation domain-containing protein
MKQPGHLKHASPPAPAGKAFTLMEMLITITVIGILAGGMALALSGHHERRALDLAAQDVVAAVGFARAQTQLTGLEHGLVLLPYGEGIRVDRTDEQSVAGQAGRDHVFAGGVRLVEMRDLGDQKAHTADRLTLGPGGFAGQIILQAPSGERRIIEVLESGQAHVQKLQ